MRRLIGLAVAVFTLTLLPTSAVIASWPTDPTQNVPVATLLYHELPELVSDGWGGAIITWKDFRSPTTIYDIYAQRLNAAGEPMWTIHGVPVSTALASQSLPQLVEDGDGGAIIAWEDLRPGAQTVDIYAQRIGPFGNVMWDSNGVAICTAPNSQRSIRMVPDGSGGAVLTWQDYRVDSITPDIYAQRIDAAGTVRWDANGLAICTAGGNQWFPRIVSDGSNGVIISWDDYRAGNWDIYAQRVDSDGDTLWTLDGLGISTGAGHHKGNEITTDDAGGAIVVWHGPLDSDIYAQRVDANGNVMWDSNGVAICTVPGLHAGAEILRDGSGGAFICWTDRRAGVTPDIYANRIDGSGSILWMTDGIPVCTAIHHQGFAELAPDGAGGFICTWQDSRNEQWKSDLFAQRVDASGDTLWPANGVAISIAPNSQVAPKIIPEGRGGAIITWNDSRTGNYDNHVYAQRVDSSGNLAIPTGIQSRRHEAPLLKNSPNPFSTSTVIEYELQEPSPVVVTIYNVRGQRVASMALPVQGVGKQTLPWNGLDDTGRQLASGIYLYRVQASGFSQTRKMVLLR